MEIARILLQPAESAVVGVKKRMVTSHGISTLTRLLLRESSHVGSEFCVLDPIQSSSNQEHS